ncbi:MAG: LEA type 2 family protein [Planctomycetes bacterium]|nr:LEA type 2 family protein [Planctomycetota bacterium]
MGKVLIGGAALAALLAVSCAVLESVGGIQRPSVRFAGARFASASFDHVDVDLHVEIRNPNAFALPLAPVEYSLDIEGKRLVDGRADPARVVDEPAAGPVHPAAEPRRDSVVPAQSAETFAIPVRVSLPQVWSLIAGAKTIGDEVAYRAAFVLILDPGVGGAIRLPLEGEGTIPVVRPPSVSIGRFSVDPMGAGGGSATIELALENPNGHALEVKGADLALEIAGTPVGRAAMQGPGTSVPPGGTGRIEIKASFAGTGIAGAIAQILLTRRVSYRLRGAMALGEERLGTLPLAIERAGEAKLSR